MNTSTQKYHPTSDWYKRHWWSCESILQTQAEENSRCRAQYKVTIQPVVFPDWLRPDLDFLDPALVLGEGAGVDPKYPGGLLEVMASTFLAELSVLIFIRQASQHPQGTSCEAPEIGFRSRNDPSMPVPLNGENRGILSPEVSDLSLGVRGVKGLSDTSSEFESESMFQQWRSKSSAVENQDFLDGQKPGLFFPDERKWGHCGTCCNCHRCYTVSTQPSTTRPLIVEWIGLLVKSQTWLIGGKMKSMS